MQVAEANEDSSSLQEDESSKELRMEKSKEKKEYPNIRITEYKDQDGESDEEENEEADEQEEKVKDALEEYIKQKQKLDKQKEKESVCPWLVAKYHPEYELLRRSQAGCSCCACANQGSKGKGDKISEENKESQCLCNPKHDWVERPETADEAIFCMNKLSELELARLCQILPQKPEAMLIQGRVLTTLLLLEV